VLASSSVLLLLGVTAAARRPSALLLVLLNRVTGLLLPAWPVPLLPVRGRSVAVLLLLLHGTSMGRTSSRVMPLGCSCVGPSRTAVNHCGMGQHTAQPERSQVESDVSCSYSQRRARHHQMTHITRPPSPGC
jgi:hypothetical protein